MKHSLFLTFEEWRELNADLEDSLRAEIEPDRIIGCACIEDSRHGRPDPHCFDCDGAGVTESNVQGEVETEMRRRYDAQLERDYRSAVRNLSGREAMTV